MNEVLTQTDPHWAWGQYEARKLAWLQQNPNATDEEYFAETQRLAKELGL